MKVRIKSGDCPSWFTIGKVYTAHSVHKDWCEVTSDEGNTDTILFDGCSHLNGGSWEIVEE